MEKISFFGKKVRWFIPFSLVSFCFIFSLQLKAQEQPISWRVDKDQYMVYRSDSDFIDPFGYEVKGNLPSPRFINDPKKVPFFLSMILPGKRISQGSSYTFGRDAPDYNALVPNKIAIKGTRKPDKNVDGNKLIHLHHQIKVRRKQKTVNSTLVGVFCKEGSMEVDIYYDPDPGFIRKVSWDADMSFQPNQDHSSATSVTGKKTYQLERHHPIGSNNFQKRVSEAIQKGVNGLIKNVEGGDNWNISRGCHGAPCPKGKAALVLLALLESDQVEKDSKLIKQGMNFVFGKTDFRHVGGGILSSDSSGKGKELEKNYSATYQEGLRLMAMEAFYQSKVVENMMKRRRKGKSLPDQFKRPEKNLRPEDTKWARGALRWFFKHHNNGGMTYGESGGYDNSNTQYAALGMYAGMNLELNVKNPAPLKKMLTHWITTQQKKGPKVQMQVGQLGNDKTAVVRNVTARGWAYGNPKANKFYGAFRGSPRMAMTAGGVGSVKILRTYLKRLQALDPELDKKSRKALMDGIAWLSENWQLREYPRHGKFYYMLYAVERAGMLNNLGVIGNHRWYPEGAELLLTRVDNWAGSSIASSFAILFLKRATNPIIETKLPLPSTTLLTK